MLSFGESFNFTFAIKNQMKWNSGRSCSTYGYVKFKNEINFMFAFNYFLPVLNNFFF